MSLTVFNNPDALPQLIGEFRPVDEWQAHINDIFYGLRGGRLRDFSQTFAAADYRLAHALASDYFARVVKREQSKSKAEVKEEISSETQPQPPLVIHEWGCGNGNLAACFLRHLKAIDKENRVYPRVRYVLIDAQEATLRAAMAHPDLAQHADRVESLCAQVQDLAAVTDGSVDRILCNELWNDLPTKLMLRKDGDVEEEFLRPNLSEARQVEIADWSGFVQAFDGKDVKALDAFPAFLEDIIWEKEYRKSDWKLIPYRKTITDFLKKIDEHVLVPVNLGAYASIKEAKRLLTPDAIGFSSFDAGTADLDVLNDPEKPCYGQFGGQYSFMINFALVETVAKHLGMKVSAIEPQKEYVGQSLATNVMSLMDLLATHPRSHALKGWEQDQLIVQTIHELNKTYHSPYRRSIEFSLSTDIPADARETLQRLLSSLKQDGIPDTIAYLTEEELTTALQDLEDIGYDRDIIQSALQAPAQNVDYYHHFLKP
ncbi:MAG TPA: class I SAM-dependent methyltransferase [Nitrospiraceae bacterium]|nr:class I SAM-dependent methyltransferase [Nitrospiraceae bacterium]